MSDYRIRNRRGTVWLRRKRCACEMTQAGAFSPCGFHAPRTRGVAASITALKREWAKRTAESQP